MQYRTPMQLAAAVAAALILGGAGAATAADGPAPTGSGPCDQAAKPAALQRTEASGPIVIIRDRVVHTTSECNRATGAWYATSKHIDVYKMYGRDTKRPCATYARHTDDLLGASWTSWHSEGRATNC